MRFETHQTVRKGLQVAVLITGGRRLLWQPLREGPPAPQNSASGALRSSSTGHRRAVRGGRWSRAVSARRFYSARSFVCQPDVPTSDPSYVFPIVDYN